MRLRIAALFALLAIVSCHPKNGDDGDTGMTGATGPAGPTGPPGPPGSANAWSRTGDAGIVPGTNFLGTTDSNPLEIRANDSRVALFGPEVPGGAGDTGGLTILGSSKNVVTPGAAGCTVEGGGTGLVIPLPNRATDDFCTVGGGAKNQAGDSAGTTADAPYATVGGGLNNNALAQRSTVSGGGDCTALGTRSTIGGGGLNVAGGDAATVAGGAANTANGDFTVIGGGSGNLADGLHAVIAGGDANGATGDHATVGGGKFHSVPGDYGTVGGGQDNTASGTSSTVGGGGSNTASGLCAAVGGGQYNTASSMFAAIPGGSGNVACGEGSTIPGGFGNETRGTCALAAGRRGLARFDGSFVWADVGDVVRSDARANQFNAFASGGVRLVTRYDENGLPVAAAELAPGGSSWLSLLDRSSVADIQPVDPREILFRVRDLPISSWSFVSQDRSIRHLGPLAEDFRAAFELGESDRHIGHIDASGVALAAIQGLCRELDLRDARIAAVESEAAFKSSRIAQLEEQETGSRRKIAELEARLERIERRLGETK